MMGTILITDMLMAVVVIASVVAVVVFASVVAVVVFAFVDSFVKSFKRHAQHPEDLPPDSEIVKMALRWLWNDLRGKAKD